VGLVSLRDLKGIIESLREKLKGRVSEAYVFGSVVKGSAVKGESDLDLIVIPREGERVDFFELLREEVNALLDLGVPLDLMVADNETYRPLMEHATLAGRSDLTHTPR